ncbi:MAG: Si-specific NAD(P)(+) transhydrogenase [Deltaproteobacteria bacterium]|nr:Si-specific NAD(P)(+) transhydrogenase [Deltaproteobacteria bacterium]
MNVEDFDIVVIGGGPAGQKAAVQAGKAGRRVVLIDRQRLLGGECVHRGTIPSKTLHDAASGLVHLKQHAARLFEVQVQSGLQVETLMERLDSVRDSHAVFMSDQLERNGVERWRGRARFVSDHELVVEGPGRSEKRIRGEHILVATGSRPRVPDNVPIDHEHILDSDSLLSLIYLPNSLTVLGGGVIACEYASIFSALGVHVTMIDHGDRPLGFMDEELVHHFLDEFSAMGGTFLARSGLDHVEYGEDSSVLTILESGKEIRSEKLLCALGRVTNTRELGIEVAGVELDARGLIQVDERYRTSVPHIYAAGDAIGSPALAASAMEQGRIAMCTALGLSVEDRLDSLPVGIYTIPEMASVGLSEAAAIDEHGSVLVGRAPFSELARGQISGETSGLLKLVASADGSEILGVHIVGHAAVELIHLAQMAMITHVGPETFIENTFNFPTMAEAYRVAALQVQQAMPAKPRKAG